MSHERPTKLKEYQNVNEILKFQEKLSQITYLKLKEDFETEMKDEIEIQEKNSRSPKSRRFNVKT